MTHLIDVLPRIPAEGITLTSETLIADEKNSTIKYRKQIVLRKKKAFSFFSFPLLSATISLYMKKYYEKNYKGLLLRKIS